MQYRKLGKTSTEVSLICLGTMTWGEQNTEAEAFEQMDYALAQGVNFFDVAEMYPVPPRKETQGRTETYIGRWFQRNKKRNSVVLATKVAGPGMDYIRNGTSLHPTQVQQALETSLRRLQTDYVDLYQLHWPARKANFFGRLGYTYPDKEIQTTALEDTLEALQKLVEQGKVRHLGISNETPWGTMRCLRIAEIKQWPPIVSVQNPYNLLNRTFEVGLAEISHRENIGLLAYSPLAFGVLSGKYEGGSKPKNARITLFDFFDRYSNLRATEATSRYVALANEAGLSPAQMSLAYINSRPFVTANIVGATTMEQLKENISSIDVNMSAKTMDAIDKIHTSIPNPSP